MIGICILSNISVRQTPDSKSEIVSQLLFGETFSIIEENNSWTKIITDDDEYTGWISSKQFEILHTAIQHKEVSTFFPYQIATSNIGSTMILAGSSIPNLNGNKFKINENIFTISDQNITCTFSDIEKVAKQYLNAPYFWGGRTPFGIDCSGFVQSVYKQCGIQLLRDAYQQAEQGNEVSNFDEIKCGDLAFFHNDEGRIIHVGMMLDKKNIIHASGKVRIDSLDKFGIMNMDENQYSHQFKIIKRIIS